MRLLYIIILCSLIWGDDFSTYKIIKQDTPPNEIIKIIRDAPKGMVIYFSEGKYDFHGRKIILKSKNYLSLESVKKSKVVLTNIIIQVQDSTYIHIKNIKLNTKSRIELYNTKHFFVNNIKLENSYITINENSAGILSNIVSKISSSFNAINIHNKSKVYIIDVDIEILKNNNSRCVNISSDSHVLIGNSRFLKSKLIAVSSLNSKVSIFDSQFLNKNLKNSNDKLVSIGLSINSSQAVLKNNKFNSYSAGITLSNESIYLIEDNKFDNCKDSIISYDSSGKMTKNIIYGNKDKDSIGINIVDSSVNILQNDIQDVFHGIQVLKNSQAIIDSNSLINLVPQSYFNKGLGIFVDDGCKANIQNTSYNSEYKYCGEAKEKSLVYLENNDNGFSLPSFFDNQKTNRPLNINFKKVKNFKNVFDDIKSITINYKILHNIDEEIYRSDFSKKPPFKILKGCLDQSILIKDNDGDEEEINMGTYIVFELNQRKLIKPDVYKDILLDNIPKIDTSNQCRKVRVSSSLKIKKNKIFVYFSIDSNVNIKEIIFEGKTLKIEEETIDNYQTKGRRIRELDKVYSLVLNGNGFNLSYDCKKDISMNMKCILNDSPEI